MEIPLRTPPPPRDWLLTQVFNPWSMRILIMPQNSSWRGHLVLTCVQLSIFSLIRRRSLSRVPPPPPQLSSVPCCLCYCLDSAITHSARRRPQNGPGFWRCHSFVASERVLEASAKISLDYHNNTVTKARDLVEIHWLIIQCKADVYKVNFAMLIWGRRPLSFLV